MKKFQSAFVITLSIVLAFICLFGVYAGTYYRADEWAISELESAETVRVERADGDYYFIPEKPTCGFIFYPGGKVEQRAYAPLLKECAKRGILCVLVRMPANLAILNVNGADGIERYPEIGAWYIGGHSLGGAMAATYLDKHRDRYAGLILLGAYSTADFSDGKTDVLSVYGTSDEVLNRDKYEKNRSNLPSDFTEKVIEGGCHSFFGSYGMQKGDGKPTISCKEQTMLTAEIIAEFIQSATV